jgi:TatD DNase family protein
MIFTDTHAHLYDPCFEAELDALMERAADAGVDKIFLPNCDLATVPPMMKLSARFPQRCFPMIGLHPCYVKEDVEAELAGLKAYLEQQSFWAIGEIGLDFYWDKTFVTQQKAAFRQQIGWARAAGLPIVIHSREATTACLDIIESEGSGTVPGILHCFSGTAAEAERTVALGLQLGIGGVVTYKKSNLRDVIRAVGIEHLVLETDAPYLAPVPYRGKRNESSYIPHIAQVVAEALSLPVAEVARITNANAEHIFRAPSAGQPF